MNFQRSSTKYIYKIRNLLHSYILNPLKVILWFSHPGILYGFRVVEKLMTVCDIVAAWNHSFLTSYVLEAHVLEGSKMNWNWVDINSASSDPWRREGISTHRIWDKIFRSLSVLLGFTPLICSTPLHPTFQKADKRQADSFCRGQKHTDRKSREQNRVQMNLFEGNLPLYLLLCPCALVLFFFTRETVKSFSFSHLGCCLTASTTETWIYPHLKNLTEH